MDYVSGMPGFGRRSVTKVLEQLNGLRLKSPVLGASARPLIALHLLRGGAVEGWLMDFGPSEGGGAQPEDIVVLHRAWPDVHQPANAVFFVSAREIQAITIFEAPATARHLLPVPTKMDLRRLADESVQELSAQTGKTIKIELALDALAEAAYATIGEQLRTLKSVFAEVLLDTAARDALKQNVNAVAIRAGSAFAAKRNGNTLELTLPTNDAVSSSALKTTIENVL